MQTVAKPQAGARNSLLWRILVAIPIIYLALILGQPAGLDIPNVIDTIRNDPAILIQQLINGLANGAIIAIIALGYTLVYGIIELVNFANSDVFMLGTFTALVALSPFIITSESGATSVPWWAALLAFIPAMAVGAFLNVSIERLAYRRLRNAPKLIVLISALGMSFVLQNVGLQLGALGKLTQAGPQFDIFKVLGFNNAAPKSFPRVFSNDNLFDYIFPPPAESTAGPGGQANPAAAGELGPEALQATADAVIEATIAADATQAALAPQVDEAATPEAPVAEDIALATEEPLPTLDPADAAVETEIAATSVALGTPLAPVAVEGEAAPPDEPTPDIIATMQSEAGGAQIIPDEVISEAGVSTDTTPQATRIRITFKDLLVIVVAIVLMLILRWFINNTKMGKAMRATAQNRAAAQIMGIDINRVIAITFAIGGALAGAAGMMTGIYNGTFVFTMGFTAGLRSFTAAVLGGIGNITGAALGGILIGILAAFSDQFLSVRWTNAWIFVVLVLVMLFRPTGLLGKSGGEKA